MKIQYYGEEREALLNVRTIELPVVTFRAHLVADNRMKNIAYTVRITKRIVYSRHDLVVGIYLSNVRGEKKDYVRNNERDFPGRTLKVAAHSINR